MIFSGSNPMLNTFGSARAFSVFGRTSLRNPGLRNVPDAVNTTPVAVTLNGMFVNTVVPKSSMVAHGTLAAARWFVESSFTVNVAISPHR